ncbi:MAG TPA: PKD domain-containing protein [Thermoanaerobaculaceae bacterium]|nr:PKD domain-containing protein [Thermoanaerobaculaceae bacterium]
MVPYQFTANPDPTCQDPLFAAYLNPGTYYSCAIGTVDAGYGTASFQVEQPSGAKVADANQAGSVNIAQPVILRFLGRIASPYTPYFQWSIPNSDLSHLACTYNISQLYRNSTCTIPAGALTAGSQAAWNLSVGVCDGGGQGSPPAPCTTTVVTVPAPQVLVTPTQNSWAFTVSPGTASIGQTVTITLQNVIPSDGSVYNNLVFDLGGGTTCDGRTQITYPCNGIFGAQCVSGATTTFNFGSADGGHTRTITGTGNLNGGGTVPANGQQSVNVTSSGTCPCPTVTTSVGGPTSAQVGQQVTFTATASAPGYSITGYSWTFGDGGTGTGSSVTHTYTSANTYTVRVTATSSCGNTGSDTMAIVIGGGGGGGGLTITPNPGTANPGQNVTFTFSPKITTPGDSLTFNFGDGTVQTASYSPICQQFGGCNTITYAYTTPGVYTVTASGVANGSSVSGSTSVTVRNTCTATSPPGTGFTWAPPQPKVGQAVQFTDQSTGSPTSWLWDFGTGASGMSLGQVTTLAAGTLTIGFSPLSPTAGQKVTFAFSPALTLSGDTLTFNFGDGTVQPTSYNASICGTSGCGKITHTYTSGGTFTVSASGIAGGGSVSGSTSITIGGSGGAGALAIAASPSTATVGQTVTFTFAPSLTQSGDAVLFSFGDTSTSTVSYPSCGIACNVVTHAYTAVGTYGVTGTGTAGGAAVAGGTAVSVVTGGGVGTSTLQNPSFTYTTAGTYTVTLTATNCKGSTPLQKQITVLPLCSQTAVPAANFTWGPTGALAGFPEQQQPYAGQQVTLTDASTNSPTSWSWYDFQELMLQPTTVTVPTFTATWTLAGDKNVRMKATNCFGTSAEVLNVVHIYPDVRHVNADFSWAPDPINTGAAVTFTAITGSANGDPDTFVWTFDDTKTPVTGNPVAHTFSCAGNHKVTLTSSRSDYSGATAKVTKLLAVNGTLCGPESVMTVDNAKLNGLNGTSWRTDVRIFNPASSTSAITLQILPVNQDNTKPFTAGPYNVPAKGTLVLNDILGWVAQTLGASFTKTALRVMYDNDQQEAPMVIGRTYTPSPGGGTYGQFTPGISVYPGTTVTPVWLTGLRNNGQQTGFRTNYSLLNLLGDSYAGNINVTLYDVTGTARKTVTLGMGPSGYLQDSIANLFGSGYTTVGTFSLRLDIPPGEDIQAYASVVDNQTGAPVLIPAGPPPTSPIYLPAVAHTSGKNGTVWRSDMQLTNPDTVTHTWNVTYLPKASDNLSVQQRQITMSSQQSTLMADALGWVFSGILPDATNTSGVLKITPADGSDVFPVVQARSFNQTANGTFGQNITPFTADSGLAADSAETRLLLTGMSTTDTGFRTNIGFVNLSETSSVNFAVYFYDEAGNLLNPVGTDSNPIPYTFALGVGGWDQDQLENRFRNAFGITLPANLRAVSAEIFVTGGGPGTVYATVIDNLTGDPVFIPAQLAP